MSVTDLRFGASALKSRSSRFSAGRLDGAAIIVVGANDLETLLLMPNSCNAVATVLRQADSKSSHFYNRSAILALPPRCRIQGLFDLVYACWTDCLMRSWCWAR